MNQRAVVMTIVLFVVIVIGMFVFAYLKNNEQRQITQDSSNQQTTEDRYSNITRIEGKHYYIDGVHTVVGEIPMPTPCDLVESTAVVAESFPEQITLNFSVINNAEFCSQVTTPARFKISTPASPEATFSAHFQNRRVELNLIEAGAGEMPDDFELFIKG